MSNVHRSQQLVNTAYLAAEHAQILLQQFIAGKYCLKAPFEIERDVVAWFINYRFQDEDQYAHDYEDKVETEIETFKEGVLARLIRLIVRKSTYTPQQINDRLREGKVLVAN